MTEDLGAEPVFWGLHATYNSTGGTTPQSRQNVTLQMASDNGWAAMDHWTPTHQYWLANMASPDPVVLFPTDTGHPNEAGHMTKAYCILQDMGAIGQVSSARIDAAGGTLVSSADCTVSNVQKTATGVSFSRLDSRLPMPIEPAARPALELAPEILDLSQYMLQVDDLAPGQYKIIVDGVESAIVDAADLAAGWNMTLMEAGPIYDQIELVRQMIRDKEGYNVNPPPYEVEKINSQATYYEGQGYVGQDLIDLLAPRTAEIDLIDIAIHNAAQPGAHDFEIELVPEPASAVLLLVGTAALLRRKR
jgi:hypothetical protein